MAQKLDCAVIGAGVVGLAIARSLALAGREVFVLESEARIGMHSSSRNSEVIHAGLYYPEDSLKARLCVQGKQMLYRYCEAHHVAHQRIGKLIVAGEQDDIGRLEVIKQQALLNGVDDLRLLDAAEVKEIEPAVFCHAALLSPSTGIIDTHELMTAMQGEIEAAGGTVATSPRSPTCVPALKRRHQPKPHRKSRRKKLPPQPPPRRPPHRRRRPRKATRSFWRSNRANLSRQRPVP